MNISSEEFERLKESYAAGNLVVNDKYLDYDDYEDEYSHNEIDEEQMYFAKMSNRFFKEHKIGFVADLGCECVRIRILRNEAEYDIYE